MEHAALTTIGLALVLGVTAHGLARGLSIPPILFYMLAGLAAGPLGAGLVEPDALGHGLLVLVEFAVAVILFEGGLFLTTRGFLQAPKAIGRLLTVTVALTALGGFLLTRWLLDFPLELAMLFGAVVVVTGPSVINPLLKAVSFPPRLRSLLHWESILGDVIGVVLVALALKLVAVSGPQEAGETGVWLALGIFTGVAVGAGVGFLLSRYVLPYTMRVGDEGLPGVAAFAAAVGAFLLSDSLVDASGPVAVAVAGFFLSALKPETLHHVRHFKDQLSVVLIGTLFVLLSASFKPDALGPQLWPMLLTAVLLGTVVRPLAVQLALLGSQVPMRERLYLGLVSPRGIISLATAAYGVLLLGGDAQGEGLLTTIFLVVLVSGSAATLLGKPLAGWLKVESRPETSGLIIIGLNRFAKELASAVSRHVPVVFFDPRMDMCEIIRGEGQKSFCTDLFDEEIYEEAVHEGYTRLMAVTLDDALNKLAVQTAGRQLGRGHVFRAEVADPGKVARMPGHQAQLAFGGDFLLKEAANALENGEGVIEERDYHGEEGVTPLLYVRGGGVCVAGKRRGPGRAICFVLRSSAKRG